ncbi:MAG: hypothetical protein KatS3mg089_0506 [Patescibacteria group bacterium]|nr:MAG: hypothetical protein KatS3mg089_0506 [Patescibacteria group bacterium]
MKEQNHLNQDRLTVKKIIRRSASAIEAIRGRVHISPEKETQTERYELRGTKIEIESPRTPIDIHLGDTHLQIIDVRGDPHLRADYLLIDPIAFEYSNQETGYKGIREDEPFTIGKSNHYRFYLSDNVSENHLRIDLRDFKLIIEDLNSTNGTVVQFDKPKLPTKEQIAAFPSSPEKMQAIAEFCEFIKIHHNLIKDALKNGGKLDHIFYSNFYNTNIDNPTYTAHDPNLQRLIDEYPVQINGVKTYFSDNRQSRGLKLWESSYWLFCNTHGGYRMNKFTNYGRLYFNLRPEYIGQIFTQSATAFRDRGLHTQMKTFLNPTIRAFNRFDKMIIYFDADEEEDVLQIVDDLYQSNQYAFDSGIPRFTVAVRDQKGRKMTGISFGEEPAFTKYQDKSFGIVRSKILADVYMNANDNHWLVTKPSPDFDFAFYKACLKYFVDPQNPAFNLQGNPERFSELRRRLKLNK